MLESKVPKDGAILEHALQARTAKQEGENEVE
jgi:hypothetical protein